MNNRIRSNINSRKAPLHPQNGKKMELHGNRLEPGEKDTTNRRGSARERKLALLHDVDKLKQKLRHEENVHRALERAFNRPIGALPRLPPYLPQHTLELLAEVAVLEEEVVRLEEQVATFRQGLYQEAAYISSRRNSEEGSIGPSNELSIRSSKHRHSRSSSQSEVSLSSFAGRSSPSVSRSLSARRLSLYDRMRNGKQSSSKPNLSSEELGKENYSCSNLVKGKPSYEKKVTMTDSKERLHQIKPETMLRSMNDHRTQCRVVEQAQERSSSSCEDRLEEAESEANRISEDILKCLINIFVRLSISRGKTMDSDSFSYLIAKASSENNVESDFRDPYHVSFEFKKRDVGHYKNLHTVEARSIDLNRKANASFLIRRLKILLAKLASLKLEGLSHHQKLAFWINTYNSCMMNAFLEHGIPDSPDMVVALMHKATIIVGGYFLNAIMIEHFILRLPYHLKYTCSRSEKNEELKIRSTFGLEWSEPSVTFALSCGSWSSPAVKVYSASQIEAELETAKRDYLQAAVGVSYENKLIIPKLLDWYMLDFAKDLDALLDWLCLQLPDEFRNEALKCLERRAREPVAELVHVLPYNFSFRYLIRC